MTFHNLRDFIKFLEKKNELIRTETPVSPILEITEIHQRLIKKNAGAVLFENVEYDNGNYPKMSVLINLFGTVDRVAMAMGKKSHQLRDIGKMLAFLRSPEPPSSIKDAFSMLPKFKEALNMRPKNISKSPCQELIFQGEEVNLDYLPIQSCWPDEPAPLITWPLVVTKNSPNGEYNLGIYRMQKLAKNKLIVRWLKHRGGAGHFANYEGEKFPITTVIGADPATILAAVVPIPENLSEYSFAGLLRGAKTELAHCVSNNLQVPASAEIVLEGYINAGECADEGPYGDHTGYYNSVEKFPVMTVETITMRKNPIYHTTFTGRPPDEPSILGEAFNEIFIPLLQQQFPEIIDFYLPSEGCSYRVAVISIKKRYAGHAKRVMMGVWSYLRQFLYTKFVIIVDEDINVRDWKDVIWAISTRSDPSRDITIIDNTPIDYLDFASPQSGLGGKMGIDATNKIDSETTREWGKKIYMNDDIIKLVDDKWGELFC